MINGIHIVQTNPFPYNRNVVSAQTDKQDFQKQLIKQTLPNREEGSTAVAQSNRVFNGLDVLGSSAPDKVRDAWMKAEAESGVDGYGMDSGGKLTQITALFAMSMESAYNGRGRDILGNTVHSAKTAVQKAIDRLGIPQNSMEKEEKLFYESFLRFLI